MAAVLYIVGGLILVISFFFGFNVLTNADWNTAGIVFGLGVISAILFIALGRIIELLFIIAHPNRPKK